MSTDCRFYFIPLLVLYILLISSFVQGFESTRNVSVDIEDFKSGFINVYFVCPDIRSKKELIRYYKIVDNDPVFLKEKRTAFGIIVQLKSASDLGKYKCSILKEDNSTRNATLNIMDKNTMTSPRTFVYKTKETTYVTAEKGPVELVCGLTESDDVTWYRPHQYHIHSGRTFKIDNIDNYSYGTYYCASGETRQSSVNVQKIILVKEKPQEPEAPIDANIDNMESFNARSNIIRYRPQSVVKNSDTVVWENPAGTVLLDHGRDLYLKSSEIDSSGYYYRINRNGNPQINIVGKVLISKIENDNMPMDVKGPVIYGGKMEIDCISKTELEKDTEIVWKRNDTIIHRGNTLVIEKFLKEAFGKYSCEIVKGKQELKTRFVNLMPEQKIESKIEMTPEPGNYYLFHSGSKKELHCEIGRLDNKWTMLAKNVIWTLNDKKIDIKNPIYASKIGRLDTSSVSILVLKQMTDELEGTYKCYQNNTVLAAKLLMERSDVLIEVAPSEQIVFDNVNQESELHCRIDTANINSSFIQWSFIPENSKTEIELPPEAKVSRPALTSSTSFVIIENTLKRHEGTYVCRVLGKKVFGRVIVKAKPVLKVSPKTITIKPGGDARFLCQLIGADGKVIWRRFDKKSLEVNKENRMGGSTQSILEIKHATKNDHGTVYECVFNKLIEQVTLFVEEECALNQRKCKNDLCIDENKFCDGKNDCGDNSDEDRTKCNECSPNAIHCDFLKGADPTKRCVIKHWQCDGIDDCGNNFDELNCPVKNTDKCIGTHFLCDDNVLIPRSYWCDGDSDCKSMEDEKSCSHPQVVQPEKQMQISIFSGSTLTLTCEMSGRPVPSITWRYNWGHLSDSLLYNITTKISNCSVITSTLTVHNITLDQSGVYSCEGIARRRVMAPDFIVTVSKGSICQKPYYNNDAWDMSMCIKCYCSNLTDECSSATGYINNPKPVESGIKPSDAAIVNYKTTEYYEPAREVTFANATLKKYYIDKSSYSKFIPTPDYYFGGAFNMEGSWLNRYGFPLTYQLILSGDSYKYIPGPLIVIKGGSEYVYYCGIQKDFRLPVYASEDKYENKIRVVLWEQEWYADSQCKKGVSRQQFMNVLINVNLLLFKVKYFEQQNDFMMSKISINEAIKTKDAYTWVNNVEKCNCPAGYSGLSCEIKSNER